jgi:N-acetyl-gamma-glutamyl-phosphate reductase
MTTDSLLRVAVLHGAGYAGGELLGLLLHHPRVAIAAVTSRSQAGLPVHAAHARLRGQTALHFVAPEALDARALDAAFVCAEHGQGAAAVHALRAAGFEGLVVDLSADHRLRTADAYAAWYGREHPHPEALDGAVYGLAEVRAAEIGGARLVANPGCFATGLGLALWPLAQALGSFDAHATAVTGASGSGGRPSAGTHFPTRDGNLRAYKVLAHQHLAEVQETLGPTVRIHFVPVSGPFTRGIWGTIHVALPDGVAEADVTDWYAAAYADSPFVRLSPGTLPELLPVVGTPFCDLGWTVRDGHLVAGFALDNLLKGAASQAVQNLNLALRWPETLGLLPPQPPSP